MMKGITPTMEAILRALAFYKYLTVSHVLALGISKSKDKSRKYFLAMMKEDLVGRQIHIAVSESARKKGLLSRNRQEYLWHLTTTWAKFLDSYTELCLPDIRFPKKPNKRLKNDYFHRISTIFIHISFQKWVQKMNGTEDKFLVYYDQLKWAKRRRFESETRLELGSGKHFSPDVICSFQQLDWMPWVFCLEVYNGNKVHYVVAQLEKLFWILDNTKKIENRIGVQSIPRILVTCDNENLLFKVQECVKKNKYFWVEGIEELLLFNLDVNVWEDFGEGWVNIQESKISLENLSLM